MCNKPTEVVLCGHVAAGAQYDFLSADDGVVNLALCNECRIVSDGMIAVLPEYEASGSMDEWAKKSAFNIRSQNVCRDCARKLGIPDRTPNGEDIWQRLPN